MDSDLGLDLDLHPPPDMVVQQLPEPAELEAIMSEFRHDYARNYTIPLSSTSYLCPNKTNTAIHSERDGEKEVVNKRKVFPPQV